jgi:hypothetical protein
MAKLVAAGSFVKRQTKESGHSHFEGSWDQLEGMVSDRMLLSSKRSTRKGYRDGVMLVDLDPFYFRSAVVKLDNKSKLYASYAPRRDGEAPFIRVCVDGEKQYAKHASVVLYRKDVLEENNERETDAEWEIVAIKARVSDEEDPLDYYTMSRNYLGMPGGTSGKFSPDDFAKSIIYWNNHAMIRAKKSWINMILSWFKK